MPKYELAVMRGMDVMRPICTFHYRDKRAFDLIACAIIADGIYGKAIQELLQNVPGDIRGTWMPSMRPMMEDEPVEISGNERAEFSKRFRCPMSSFPLLLDPKAITRWPSLRSIRSLRKQTRRPSCCSIFEQVHKGYLSQVRAE
jgi:hypothetical protein